MIKPIRSTIMLSLVMLLALTAPMAQAATVIEVMNSNELTTVVTDGQFARMDLSGSEYVIVDYRKRSVKIVNPQQKHVMSLDTGNLAATASGPLVQTAIQRLGNGVDVAGYPTEKYSYSANGRSCGLIYGSRDVYQKPGIKELFRAIQVMMKNQRAVLGGLAAMVDDCTLADMHVSDHVKTVGVPMRTDKNGHIEMEIKSIKYGVSIPPDTFVIPASYKSTAMQDQVGAAKQGVSTGQQPKVQNQQPQGQQMMRQMQRSGQLTPEMMEQMRRGQEMVRQPYQPQYQPGYQQQGY